MVFFCVVGVEEGGLGEGCCVGGEHGVGCEVYG